MRTTMTRPSLLIAVLAVSISVRIAAADAQKPTELAPAELGATEKVHSFGTTLLCSQPSADDLAEARKRGIEVVITLREDGELDWDEEAVARGLGLEFYRIPFRQPETLTDQVFDRARRQLVESRDKPLLLHCGSANRVGAIWLAYRVLDQGASVEQAGREAAKVGLRTEAYHEKALQYIRRQQAQQSDGARK